MVTVRRLFSILLTMAILMFMFQASQVIKEKSSHYDVNEYGEIKLSEQYVPKREGKEIVLCGKSGDPIAKMAEEWCGYTKRELLYWNTNKKEEIFDLSPEFILVDSSSFDFQMDTIILQKMVRKGVPIVFANLPDPKVISRNGPLASMLGIRKVRQNWVEIEGIHLFQDFLLGGEAIYKTEKITERNAGFQDFVLSVPWYDIRLGSKAYMVGMMDEKKVPYDEFPPLIWRNYCDGVMVFAVNGDFCEGVTGFGILDAMCYEMSEYTLYPVVNAQNVLLADYPLLAEENTEQTQKFYERTTEAMQRDIMWPSILSLATKERLKLTAFFSTKLDYAQAGEPSSKMVSFYLQQLKEINAEAGRSFHYIGGTTAEEKLQADDKIYKDFMENYWLRAGYVRTMEEIPKSLLNREGRDAISALFCEERGDLPLLSYLTDTVTLQGITERASRYTYRTDLQARSLATALAYANTVLPMDTVIWPLAPEEYWEKYAVWSFSYMSTYWTRFKYITRTTATESDYRVRKFLNLEYSEKQMGDKIELSFAGGNPDAWFLFRAHEKNIHGIENGTYEKIEENTYLIHAEASLVTITLIDSKDNLRYTGPVFDN